MRKITYFCISKKNKNRYNIYLDEEFFSSIQISEFENNNFDINSVINEQELYNIILKSDLTIAKDKAIKAISRSRLTAFELLNKLKKYDFCDEAIYKTIEIMKDYKYIDDLQYAKDYFSYSKSKGRFRLKQELKQKGISESIIEESLEDISFEFDDLLNYARRYASSLDLSERKSRDKLFRHLAYRGYDYNDIQKCINILEDERNE